MVKFFMPSLEEVLATIPYNSKEIEDLNKRLKPTLNIYGSREGFMGEDENLREIILSDYYALNNLGISYKQISNRLDYLMDLQGIGRVGRYKFGGEITCGEQRCPWKDEHTCNQYIMWLVPDNNKDFFEPGEVFNTPATIKVSGIMPHLIQDHYFFQGGKSKYRLDPITMADIVLNDVEEFK